jgi:5-formyltetrahydrofolate cyclo-ligase
MTKRELRKKYLEKRKALSEAAYLQLNRQLCENFFLSIELSFIRVLHTFIPITKNKEVDTWLLIDRIRREFPHIKISVPRVNNETETLENFYFEGIHQLTSTSWGIQEPAQGALTNSNEIDLVLVPLLTFDERGHRVGYGKGYYDRFLATCSSHCQKVGLSLFDPIEKIIDIEPSDHKLDKVITPTQVYQF